MPRRVSVKTKHKRKWGFIDLQKPEEYKPWIHSREMCSGNGRRHVFADVKHKNRTIHLFSDLEKKVYEHLHSKASLDELFEQVPLNPEETMELCNYYNIKHPQLPGDKDPMIMTTDFLAIKNVSGQIKIEAYSVKYSKDLENPRTREKLFIEMMYWKQNNIPWCIITEEDL